MEALPLSLLALLEPLSPEAPCGVDLEYHPDLLVLQNQAAPQEAAQYGDFVAPATAVNWRDIESGLGAILAQGRDLRAFILLLRCRLRLAGADGAREGLHLIAELLHRYPDDVHPQRQIDGESDAALQANALSLLVDEHSVLTDFREILIDRGSATRLTLRDVERAFAIPRQYDAPEPESVTRQLASLAERGEPALLALAAAQADLTRIAAWSVQHLGPEAPDLTPLVRLLAPFEHRPGATAAVVDIPEPSIPIVVSEPSPTLVEMPGEPPLETPTNIPSIRPPASVSDPLPPPFPPSAPPASRDAALALVRAARLWFEQCEPSSPVADLLRQAERLTGKPYYEIADAIPLELLARWRNQDA